MVILKQKRIIPTFLITMALIASIAFPIHSVLALSANCQTEECKSAAKKEAEAKKNQREAIDTANLYSMQVSAKKAEISSKEQEINQIESTIAQKNKEIDEKIKEIDEAAQKLDKQQNALAKLIVEMHFETDIDPILILAGSSSISDLAEKEARNEVVEDQVTASSKEIKELKLKLEADKQKLEEDKKTIEIALEEQQKQRQELISAKSELDSIVQKYSNDATAYEQEAKAQAAIRIAEEKAYQEAHREIYVTNGGGVYYGYNTYPWQEKCPDQQDWYYSTINGQIIGGYVCECVSYAGWKAYESYGVYLSWGNAYNWDNRARSLGYTVNTTPEEGAIGQTDYGIYGHVFWVESVNGDGSINISEYNNYYSTGQLTGSYHMGDFGSRVIPAYDVHNYNYIHF